MSVAMALMTVVAFAQTGTKEDPLMAHPDLNQCNHGSSEGFHDCYWKMQPARDGVLLATPSDIDFSVDGYNANTGDRINGADIPNYGKAYAFKAIDGVLIKVNGYGTVGFNAEYFPQEGTGLEENYPVNLYDGEKAFLGDPDGTEMTTTYARYYANEDGTVILSTNSYVNKCYLNGEEEGTSFQYNGGKYTYKFSVKAGETYNLKFENYNPILVTTEITHPAKGSIDNPIEIRDGANLVVSAPGTYYYTFTQPNLWGGYAKITSDAELPGGQVKIYKNASGVGYNDVMAKSQVGSFNVEFETEVFNDPVVYYVVVERKQAGNPAGEKFNFKWERYTEGSDKDNPHMINSFPYTATTETEFNPVYYAIDVPAGEVWNVTARATGSILNPNTKVKIYDPENQFSRYDEGNSSAVYDLLGKETGYRYLITWDSKETAAIHFEVTKKEVEEGDIIGKPITATLGNNNIATKGTGTKFYTYQATRNGKFAITTSREEINVSFPKGTGPYDGTYECIKNGSSSYLPGTEGTLYYIKLEGLEDGDSFTVSESDYAAGEDRTTAIEVKDGVFNVENAPLNKYWLKYTATRNCMLKIEGTMDASNGSAAYAKNDDFWTTDMKVDIFEGIAIVKKFITELSAREGDVFYVCFSVPKSSNGKAFNFIERDFELGESVETAFQIVNGNFSMPKATLQNPIWAKVTLNEGEFHLESKERFEYDWYTNQENALAEQGEHIRPMRTTQTNIFYTDNTITTPGVYYLRFTDTTDAPIDFTASGSAITDEVIPYPHRKMYGFYLRNNLVDGYGLFSMYMDDLQNAEPIYRYDETNSQIGAFCGAVVDDYWYGVNYVYSMSGPPIPSGFVKINIKNGEYHYIGEWAGQDEDGLRFQDMTYDYKNKIMYAVGFNAGESAIYKFNLETGVPTKVVPLSVEIMGNKKPITLGTLACDLEGNLYGMQAGDGKLYQVDLATGIITPIFETTFTQMPGNQSMEFDRTTGLLYWSSCTYGKDEGKDTWLVVFDLKNKKLYCDENSKMGLDASCEGLYIPFITSGPSAAAAPENLIVAPGAQGAKNAKLTWTTPRTTFDGRNFLKDKLDKLTITRNNEVIQTYTNVKAGVDMNYTDFDITEDGTYKYAVYATTEVGDGDMATAYEYIGIDYPNAVTNFASKPIEGCAGVRLTWDAPEGAAHNGYYDPKSLRYRVKRYVRGTSGGSVIAEDIDKPEFTDDTMGRLMSYWYSVTAYNEMGESERVTGDYIIAGPSVTPPVVETLTDVESFRHTWTMKDGNDDLYSWFMRSGMDSYTFGTSALALEYIISPTMTPPDIDSTDEWVITPPINFESDKSYVVSFQTRNITTETLEIHTGNTNDPESMTKCFDLTLEETPTNTDGIIDFVSNVVELPKMDGVHCVGIRLTSPMTELMDPTNPYSRKPAYFEISSFVIAEGTGVENVESDGEGINIAFDENGINIIGGYDKAVLYDASGRTVCMVTDGMVSTEGLNGKVGLLVITQGNTTKVFKIMR